MDEKHHTNSSISVSAMVLQRLLKAAAVMQSDDEIQIVIAEKAALPHRSRFGLGSCSQATPYYRSGLLPVLS
jgi:hypothetical protein